MSPACWRIAWARIGITRLLPIPRGNENEPNAQLSGAPTHPFPVEDTPLHAKRTHFASGHGSQAAIRIRHQPSKPKTNPMPWELVAHAKRSRCGARHARGSNLVRRPPRKCPKRTHWPDHALLNQNKPNAAFPTRSTGRNPISRSARLVQRLVSGLSARSKANTPCPRPSVLSVPHLCLCDSLIRSAPEPLPLDRTGSRLAASRAAMLALTA